MYVIKNTNENIKHIKNHLTQYEWVDGIREDKSLFYIESDGMVIINDTEREAFPYLKNDVRLLPYKSETRVRFKQSKLKPYDFQKTTIDFLIKRLNMNKPIKLAVTLPPGKGKTLISGKTLSKHKHRFAIVILASYIDKWVKDVEEQFGITKDNLFIVQGRDTLVKLMNMKTKDIPKIVIFSNRTLLFAIKNMDIDPLPIPLYGLMEHMDMDTVLIDEIHQEFESQYKIQTILNPYYTLGLSATFHSDVPYVNERMKTLIKPFHRIAPLCQDRYRNIIAVKYIIGEPIKTDNYYTKFYSHSTFESNLMKKPKMLLNYLNMIKAYVTKYYINRKSDRGKLLIFAATIKMIEYIDEMLQDSFKCLKYDIRQYTGKDPIKNVLESDISISTVGSAGTAIDIDGLTTVIMTVSMHSTNANQQVFGRLREIEGVELNFIYLFAEDNIAMTRHHANRIKLLSNQAKDYQITRYVTPLSSKGLQCL